MANRSRQAQAKLRIDSLLRIGGLELEDIEEGCFECGVRILGMLLLIELGKLARNVFW